MPTRRFALTGMVLVVSLTGVAQAADLSRRGRLDASDVARKRIHTQLTLRVAPGPLTLVFPKWIPGEHAPTGPLESMIGLSIMANDVLVPWARDPIDVYAFKLNVPRAVDHLDITIDSGLTTSGGSFTAGQTSSDQLAVLSWNQFVLLPKGRDSERISTHASLVVPEGWAIASALR